MSASQRLAVAGMALVGMGWMLGCTLTRTPQEAERLLLAGNLPRAAERYEQALIARPRPARVEQALYRLAILYASPGEIHDLRRSQLRLARLLREFPHGKHRLEALMLRALIDQLLPAEARLAAAEAEVATLTVRTAACQRTSHELREDQAALLWQGIEDSASRQACQQAVATLRRRLAERNHEIKGLKQAMVALERLRRIDTERQPGGG